ncbi:MAG: oligopeptide/dipeptide ABC transporter ATP-binding protein, partial [Betaproteobacteria bacterium]
DLGVIAEMCDRVAVMYAGKVVETGSVLDIFDRPAHPYTRGLLASRPRIDAGALWLSTIEGAVPVLGQMPPGCSFAPRCPLAQPACGVVPKLREVGPAHRAACITPFAPEPQTAPEKVAAQ